LSAVTYEGLEQPIRRKKPWPFAGSRPTVLAGMFILTSVGGLAVAAKLNAQARAEGNTVLAAAYAAKTEGISYPAQCTHFKFPFAGLAPIDDCTIGGSAHQRLIVLWGDSHAYHFIPALADYAERKGLRLLPRTMGACLPAVLTMPGDIPPRHRLEARSCVEFNAAVIDSLPELKTKGATAVVLAGRWSSSLFWNPSGGGSYESLAQVVETIRQNDLEVVIFADVPDYSVSVPECVVRRGIGACNRNRAEVERERAPALKILKRIVLNIPGVSLWDPINEMCDAERCVIVHNDIVLYKDDHHLSMKASQRMSTAIGIVLDPALDERMPTATEN
jgi:hypothetical protein